MRAIIAAAAVFMMAAPALAQNASRITAEQAIAIAEENGMVRLKDVDREDYGWEIEGWTADGREIEVEINHDGSVRDIEYDD